MEEDRQNGDLINQIKSLSEQENFDINSFKNEMEHLINQNFSLSFISILLKIKAMFFSQNGLTYKK